jgi:hypothetical protein
MQRRHHPIRATGKPAIDFAKLTAPLPFSGWPSFTGTAQLVGSSPSTRVTVYYDPSLGTPALQNAQDLVADADRIVAANDTLFGTTGGQVSVIVFALGGATDGSGGADHMACDYVSGAAIEVCASFGNSARVSALFEAELSECSMGGNLCGVSTGEALSRWCAMTLSNNALSDFATSPQWVADGMPDWVNQTEPTDQSADSTGCGMAFISWLKSYGITLSQITRAIVQRGELGTFAQVYADLLGDVAANAWPAFQAAIKLLPNGVQNVDPFAGLFILPVGQSASFSVRPVKADGSPAQVALSQMQLVNSGPIILSISSSGTVSALTAGGAGLLATAVATEADGTSHKISGSILIQT